MPCCLPAPSTADALDAGDNSTLADLRTQFLALDTNADGLVAPAEFDSELTDYLPYGNSTDAAAPVSGRWAVQQMGWVWYGMPAALRRNHLNAGNHEMHASVPHSALRMLYPEKGFTHLPIPCVPACPCRARRLSRCRPPSL